MKIIAFGPITSWQIDGEIMETETLFSWAPKSLHTLTEAMKLIDACSLEEKVWHRQCIKKQRHFFANKGPYSQRYGFSSNHVWMLELDHKGSWTPKNWCFWTVVLRVSRTARRSNQSILKKINPEYSLEGLMFKLKLQYFGHLMWRTDSFEKTLMLGKIEGGRRRGRQRMRWLDDNHWLNGHEFE